MEQNKNFAKYLAVFAAGVVLGICVFELCYASLRPLQENDAQIVTDRDYVPVAMRELQNARESVHVVMFSATRYNSKLYKDSSINQLLSALANARARDLDVRVIVDDWPTGNPSAKKFLEESNVAVKAALDENSTTHAKLIIIDGRIVIVGSTNWSYHSVEKNHEANIILYDEDIARQFESYFEGLWKLF